MNGLREYSTRDNLRERVEDLECLKVGMAVRNQSDSEDKQQCTYTGINFVDTEPGVKSRQRCHRRPNLKREVRMSKLPMRW